MKKHKMKPIETFFVIHMLAFGIVLLFPNNTLTYNTVYQSMALMTSEGVWGIACIVVSLIQLYAMFKNHKKLKILGLALVTFFYSFIGTMFLITAIVDKVVNTGITYFVISGFALWLAYTIGGQNE